MTSEWRQCTLGDVIELKRGYDLPTVERRPGDVPIVSSSGPSGWHDKAMAKAPGVVTGRYGTIGQVFFIEQDYWPLNTTLYVRDFKGNDERFVAYFLRSMDFQSFNDKSSVPGLNRNDLHLAPVVFPPVEEQIEIAAVLSSLDEKIEQNRRTGAKLEGLARAVFKAWFVDFEPVKAKAAGATTFPGMPPETFATLPTHFVNSPLDPVPEGWEVKPATDIATVAIGKTPPRKEPQWFSTNPADVRWVSISDMGSCGMFIRETSEYLTAAAVEKFNVRRIPDRSVLFSFKLTVGRVTIVDGETTSNEAIAHFVPLSPNTVGTEYLYCYLSAFDHTQLGSTSSIATATNSKAVKSLPVLVPDPATADGFTATVRPVFELIRAQSRESAKLATLRDYLLPRLLSGRVRVGKLDRATQEDE